MYKESLGVWQDIETKPTNMNYEYLIVREAYTEVDIVKVSTSVSGNIVNSVGEIVDDAEYWTPIPEIVKKKFACLVCGSTNTRYQPDAHEERLICLECTSTMPTRLWDN